MFNRIYTSLIKTKKIKNKQNCAQIAQVSANASDLSQQWSGIRIQISRLIRFRIQMSAGSLPKCCGLSCRCKLAYDCTRYANKSIKNPLFHNAEGSGKVIRNPYPAPEHHQKLISSADWSAQSSHQVSMKSADYFCSNPAQTDRQTDRQTNRDCITST